MRVGVTPVSYTHLDVYKRQALGHTQNADDGDCTTAVTCKRCDYVFIPAKEHDCSGEWKSDQTGHWKTCKNDGCTKVDKKAHTANITCLLYTSYGAVRGVGGIDSWGSHVDDEYCISVEEDIDYSFTIC